MQPLPYGHGSVGARGRGSELGKNLFGYVAVDVGEPKVPSTEMEGQLGVVQAHDVE